MGARGELEAVQKRLDKNPDAMRTRRETIEHPFGTMKMRMGATHFLCKRLPKVADGKPRRMSVWPVASHTRMPAGKVIMRASGPRRYA
jgi:hypothetical protein